MSLRKKRRVDAPKGAVVCCQKCNRRHGRLDACTVTVVRRGGILLQRPSEIKSKDWVRIMESTGATPREGTEDYVAPNRATRRAQGASAKRRADGTAFTRRPLRAHKPEPGWPQKPTTRVGVSRKQIAT